MGREVRGQARDGEGNPGGRPGKERGRPGGRQESGWGIKEGWQDQPCIVLNRKNIGVGLRPRAAVVDSGGSQPALTATRGQQCRTAEQAGPGSPLSPGLASAAELLAAPHATCLLPRWC